MLFGFWCMIYVSSYSTWVFFIFPFFVVLLKANDLLILVQRFNLCCECYYFSVYSYVCKDDFFNLIFARCLFKYCALRSVHFADNYMTVLFIGGSKKRVSNGSFPFTSNMGRLYPAKVNIRNMSS